MISKIILIGVSILLVNFMIPAFAQEQSDKIVIIETASGKLTIELFPKDAPKTVENFIKLVESGFYEGTVFHRVIKDFMIQGGDPLTKPGAFESFREWGTGNAGYTIPGEFNSIKHNRGIVSMARSADPDSASSQFFIVEKNSNFLDGQYTAFGRLVTQESYDTLDKIASLETDATNLPFEWITTEIKKTEVVNRSEITDILDQGEPDRMTQEIISKNETYSNKKLGISFNAPEGWVIQEPEKTHPLVPDLVIVGPRIWNINPTISISVINSEGKNLDDKIKENRDDLKPALESGDFKILSENRTKINKNNAHITEAVGIFNQNNEIVNVKFKEVIFATKEKFYSLTYASQEVDFDTNLQKFDDAINSFKITSQMSNQEFNQTKEGGGCLIATATYGTELAPQVQQLRELRDNSLLRTESGSAFMTTFNEFYYSFSPTIADFERQSPVFREAVKIAITPMISTLSILNYVDMDSEVSVLGYGLAIISLNIGMYFVAPAIILFRIRR